jgi:hypothetical protein
MDTNKTTHELIMEAQRIRYLEERTKALKPLKTVRYDMTEQERKELEEYIKLHSCPF